MTPPVPASLTSDRRLLGTFAVLCAVWSSTWVVIAQGLEELPALGSAAVRFALAGLAFEWLAPRLHRREGGEAPGAGLVWTQALGNFAIPYGLTYRAELVLPSGLVAVLWASFPLFSAMVAAWMIPSERLSVRQWSGVLVALLGVGLLFRTDLARLATDDPRVWREGGLLLLGPLASALASTRIKAVGGHVSSALLNRDGMLVGALLLGAASLVLEPGRPLELLPRGVFSLVYLSLVGTVLTFGLYFWAMRRVPSYQLSLVAFVTPGLALLLGAVLRDEPVHGSTLAGAATILVGVALVLFGTGRTGRARRPAPGPSEAQA